jgi:prolyl oligopeptidase
MKTLRTVVAGTLLLAAACADPPPPAKVPTPAAPAPAGPQAAAPRPFAYPVAPRGDLVERVQGLEVRDPYRPLEDLEAPATRAWVAAENALTDRTLGALPARTALRDRITALSKVETNAIPVVTGTRLTWGYDDGTQDQQVVMTASTPDDKPRVLLDPAAISPDGKLSLATFDVSDDGTKLLYGLAVGGGDWHLWRLRDIATGKDLPDELTQSKYYAPRLTHDGKGIYYSRFPAPPPGRELSEPDHDCKVYFHAVGTPAASDRVVYERPDHPTWQFRPTLTEDGRYLVIETGDGEVGDRGEEEIVVLDTKTPGAKPTVLVGGFDAEYVFLGSEGTTFYLQTNRDAATKRVIAVDLRNPDRAHWKQIVAPGADAIDTAMLVGGQLVVVTVKDAHSAVTAYDLSGKKLRDVPLPGIGQAYGFEGKRGATSTYFRFESFTSPGAVYRYDLAKGTTTPWRTPAVAFDPAAFETTQVFYPSKDGTKIPMFVTSKKGLARDGSHPTMLTAYGFAGVSNLPYFAARNIAWLEQGGVLATANIRGGGEYGEAWHRAAMLSKKQVSYDDFIAAAEWLIASKITSKEHLGIVGRSGGGMLVGVAVTQRPDLFGAAAPLVGVLDLMRFHLFGEGAGWAGDLGSPTNPAEAPALLAASPLHNVKPGTRYPAMYIGTGDHDVRVVPLHSYKFAAAVQAAQAGPAPILLRVLPLSGHGGPTTKPARRDSEAELLTFFTQYLR